MNVVSQTTLTITHLGEARLRAGHVEDASEQAMHALALARDRNERGYQAWAHRLLGEIASHQDELAESAASYREALKLADKLGMRPLTAHCHLGLGRLERRTDGSAAAEERVLKATKMYRDMDMNFWVAQAETELAKVGTQ